MVVRLPRLLAVTDRRVSFMPLEYQIERVLAGVEKHGRNARSDVGVLLREKDLDFAARLRLAQDIAELTSASGAWLLVATSGRRDGGAPIAGAVGAQALHLSSDAQIPSGIASTVFMGRSCHSAEDYGRATLEGMDYVTISPIFDSLSKSGLVGRGLDLVSGLRGAAKGGGSQERGLRRPAIYALGGIDTGKAGRCIEAGAYGVAVCGALMGARDPSSVAVALLTEIDAARERSEDR